MHPTIKAARVAGALYLLLALAPFHLIYIPGVLYVRGNATATAGNIAAHELLLRFGIVSALITGVVFMFLGLALYRLLSGVSKSHAAVMVILVLISAAIGFVNELNNIAALMLARGADFLAALEKPQRDALAMLFLRLHGQGNVLNESFWGLWLLPFGVLVMRSGFLPRILGAWLILNGFAYLILSFAGLLLPHYHGMLFKLAFPALLGELAIMLWLLIKGAKVQPSPAPAG